MSDRHEKVFCPPNPLSVVHSVLIMLLTADTITMCVLLLVVSFKDFPCLKPFSWDGIHHIYIYIYIYIYNTYLPESKKRLNYSKKMYYVVQ